MNQDEPSKAQIAECCSVCTFSPFVAKRGVLARCKRINEYVSPYMVCGKFDIDEKRVAKRIGGFKTALSRRARKDS